MLYAQIVAMLPDHADALHLLGLTHAQRGDVGAAVRLIRRAIAQRPDFAQAHYNLGNALRSLGDDSGAIAAYRAAVAIDPALASAWGNLGATLRTSGDYAEAAIACREAIRRRGDDAGAHYNLGCALQYDGRLDEAVLAYRRALAVDPDHNDAKANLGAALMAAGRPAEALDHLQGAARRAPDSAEAQIMLSAALISLGAAPAAIKAGRRATLLGAHDPAAWSQYAKALREGGESGAAVHASRRASALAPHDGELLLDLAISLQEHGDTEGARDVVRRAVAANPNSGTAWTLLVGLEKFPPDDARLTELATLTARLSADPGRVEDAIHAGFALGKARLDAGAADEAFAALAAANRLHRARIDYDVAEDIALFEEIARTFDADWIAARNRIAISDARPIFIVGIPRSGTTLVEQILAAHPSVQAGGEMKHLDLALYEHLGGVPAFGEWRAKLPTLDAVAVRTLGGDYLRRVATTVPLSDGQRFTDKMPSNFRHAGLIHLMFPEAIIIDCRRSPLDTCLSCFATHFAQGQYFTYDLAELGAYYRAYATLMAHWRRVLPADRLIVVQYEDVVADLEGEARRLTAACGLPWDNACLSFHRARRPVRTASVNQVRKPLYTTSVARARNYADHLRALGLSSVDQLTSTPEQLGDTLAAG